MEREKLHRMPKRLCEAPVEEWTVDQVCEWAKANGHGGDKFREEGIDGRALFQLDRKDVAPMFSTMGARTEFFYDVTALEEEEEERKEERKPISKEMQVSLILDGAAQVNKIVFCLFFFWFPF
jgi:hypothetical protein